MTCAAAVSEHKHRLIPGFTSKYFLERLVETDDVGAAFARETELKGWRRSKKIAVIQKVNPQWSDLSCDLIEVEVWRRARTNRCAAIPESAGINRRSVVNERVIR